MAIGDVPIPIFELAEGCRRFVHSAVGVELDYSQDTLPILDEYLRVVRKSVADRPGLEAVVTGSIAAYFGEVVRQHIDGFWRRDPRDQEHWLLAARRAYLSMSPLGIVLESLAEGAERPGPAATL